MAVAVPSINSRKFTFVICPHIVDVYKCCCARGRIDELFYFEKQNRRRCQVDQARDNAADLA